MRVHTDMPKTDTPNPGPMQRATGAPEPIAALPTTSVSRRALARWSGLAAGALALDAALPAAALADDTVHLDPDRALFTVSKHLTGLHFVYSYDDDAVYADGKIADWARRAGIGAARFPGGTIVKFWDWEHPTGVMTNDAWDPAYDRRRDAPPSDWMSLDEFLAFARRSGVLPILGVNMLAGQKHGREADSIARAARMVAYVKQRGFAGVDWYLGNEEIGAYGGVEAFAKVFARHARAMKAVDPTLRAFWNDNDGDPRRILAFLASDDGQADGYETHGKYPYGGEYQGLGSVSVAEWRIDQPIRDRKNFDRAKGGRVWRAAANVYRRAAAAAGRPTLLIANNEYGLGPNHLEGFDRYTYGLILCEFLMELLIGNWDRTAFWSNVLGADPDPTARDDQGLIAVNHGRRLNPFHYGLEAVAAAQGGRFVAAFDHAPGVHGCAVRTDRGLRIYLLNKSASPAAVAFQVPGAASATITSVRRGSDDFGVTETGRITARHGRLAVRPAGESFSWIDVGLSRA